VIIQEEYELLNSYYSYIMRYMHSIPGSVDGELDELFEEAVKIVTQYDRASASLIQRRLSIGYSRAARIIDQLECAGVIAPADGAAPREVLSSSYEDFLANGGNTSSEKQEDPFAVSANYKVPTGLKLSRSESNPWGKQFSDIFNSKDFRELKSRFSIPIGYDDEGKLHTESLLDAGNFIIAGNTLSQKENFVDSILLTYLLQYRPDELRLILHDPTHYLDLYYSIPHLLTPVMSEQNKLISALRWALDEMNRRLKLFAEAGVRNIGAFNELSGIDALPHILLITFYNISDWDTEDAIPAIAGVSIRTGIHTIVVVDRTTGKSLPTGFKSTIPARIVFRLPSAGESKAIDVSGAEKLEAGEVIYKPNFGGLVKLKAIYTPENNVKEVVEAVKESSD
jgi:DNA segregation ATPase FtsK/SpoIIIE-like protein